MSTQNTNLRIGNERRVNLAMTAELALGNGVGNKNNQNTQYNAPNQVGVTRIRGGDANGDILGTYLPSGHGNSKGFNQYSEENKDLGGGYKSAAIGLPPRGYNPNNEFNHLNGLGNNGLNGLTTNNNITNQYKPSSNGFGGNDILNNFQTQSSNSNIGNESNGFKIQRVRGVANQGPTNTTTTPFGMNNNMNNNQTNLGMQTFGGGSAQLSGTQNSGFGLARINSKKDENTDIDFQTKQLKSEIDSLDQKLNFKQTNAYQSDSSPRGLQNNNNNNNVFKSSGTNFGSNNNINTAFNGSGKNFYNSNNNIDNQLNSTSSGSNNNIYGNGFGGTFGSSSSSNNINNNNNNNNNYNNFGNSAQNAFNTSGNNFTAANSNQLNNPQNNATNQNNRLPPRGRPPIGPNSNNLEDILATKTDGNENTYQGNEVKKVPVNSGVFNENSRSGNNNNNTASTTETDNNQAKEFSTGTYDPSNILNPNRQGRMRSLGRNNQNQNQHEEKPAQATGSKNLPDQVPLLEEFLCPEGCGRTFNKKALAKHIPLCKKLFQPKKDDPVVEQKKIQIEPRVVSNKNTADDKKAIKPPKVSKKPDSKEVKQRDNKIDQKTEALRKLKEQKRKELMEQQQNKDNEDDGIIDEPNDDQYI